jgi:hypothetical protein
MAFLLGSDTARIGSAKNSSKVSVLLDSVTSTAGSHGRKHGEEPQRQGQGMLRWPMSTAQGCGILFAILVFIVLSVATIDHPNSLGCAAYDKQLY